MNEKLRKLILKIRNEKLKYYFIEDINEYDFLWSEVSAEIKKTVYVLPLVRIDLNERGIEHFLLKGIPIILKESYDGKPL